MVANICGCSVADSEALLQCLRTKSSAELLGINQVKQEERFGGPGGSPLEWSGRRILPLSYWF